MFCRSTQKKIPQTSQRKKLSKILPTTLFSKSLQAETIAFITLLFCDEHYPFSLRLHSLLLYHTANVVLTTILTVVFEWALKTDTASASKTKTHFFSLAVLAGILFVIVDFFSFKRKINLRWNINRILCQTIRNNNK